MTDAQGFKLSAHDYLSGIQALPPTGRVDRLYATGAAFALECTLKAYLAHSGVKKGKIKKHYGHNLEKLWKAAVQRGLSIQPTVPQWCLTLNHITTGPRFYVRYQSGVHGIVYPNRSAVLSGISGAFSAVNAIVP